MLCSKRCHCWHSGMPLCRTRTVSRVLRHHQAAPSPVACNQWMTWMDSSMNERMPTYLHVPFCCFVLCCLRRFFPFSLLTHFPHFPLLVLSATYGCFVWWSFNFPTFPAPTFSPFSLSLSQCLFFLGHFSCSPIFPIFPLWCSKCFLFLYCHVSDCQRWFLNDFSILYSLFVFVFGGGG